MDEQFLFYKISNFQKREKDVTAMPTTSFPGFSPTRPTEREGERDPEKRWSRGSRTK